MFMLHGHHAYVGGPLPHCPHSEMLTEIPLSGGLPWLGEGSTGKHVIVYKSFSLEVETLLPLTFL